MTVDRCRGRGLAVWSVAVLAAVLTGCNFGPSTIPRDRFDYADAVSTSTKRQALINIVRLRYLDRPTWVAVRSVVNQYNLEGELTISTDFANSAFGDVWGLEGGARYYDRPTITYSPLTGERFVQEIIRPVPPRAVLSLIEAGWAASMVFRLAVESINGIPEAELDDDLNPVSNPVFEQLLRDLDVLQRHRMLGVRLTAEADGIDVVLVLPRSDDERMNASRDSVCRLLDLDPAETLHDVRYGSVGDQLGGLPMQTRSIYGMALALAAYVDVPTEHLEKSWAMPDRFATGEIDSAWAFLVHSSTENPPDAFVKVRYEGHWFWIDKGDLQTKRLMALYMLFASIVESPDSGSDPVVTIPVG